GKRLATGDHKAFVKVWDIVGDQRGTLLDHAGQGARAALALTEGKVVVALEGPHRVDWLDLRSGASGRQPIPGLNEDLSAALSRDGTWLAFPVAPDGDALEVWDVVQGKRLFRSPPGPGKISAVAFSPDGRWLLASHVVPQGPAPAKGTPRRYS